MTAVTIESKLFGCFAQENKVLLRLPYSKVIVSILSVSPPFRNSQESALMIDSNMRLSFRPER
jgi:hypothetical protein